MTPLAVFLRTFLRTSAIFAGASIVFLHPPLEWSASGGAARAQKSPIEAAVDGLLVALKDPVEDVRCQAAWALGRAGKARAVEALIEALKVKADFTEVGEQEEDTPKDKPLELENEHLRPGGTCKVLQISHPSLLLEAVGEVTSA